MPASTFEVISNTWVPKEKILKDIEIVCSRINATFFNEGDLQIHKKYDGEEDVYLIIDINDEKTLEWFYNQYPDARNEPIEHIPYYVFDERISTSKLYSIISANCYLDDRLIFDFSLEYLNINPSQYIYINRSGWFNLTKLESIKEKGYYPDWLYENQEKGG